MKQLSNRSIFFVLLALLLAQFFFNVLDLYADKAKPVVLNIALDGDSIVHIVMDDTTYTYRRTPEFFTKDK